MCPCERTAQASFLSICWFARPSCGLLCGIGVSPSESCVMCYPLQSARSSISVCVPARCRLRGEGNCVRNSQVRPWKLSICESRIYSLLIKRGKGVRMSTTQEARRLNDDDAPHVCPKMNPSLWSLSPSPSSFHSNQSMNESVSPCVSVASNQQRSFAPPPTTTSS